MFKEHEQIVLTADVFGDEGEELKSGDVGTIIHIHPNEEALVVEFMSPHWRHSGHRDGVAITGASRDQRGPHTLREQFRLLSDPCIDFGGVMGRNRGAIELIGLFRDSTDTVC